MWLPLLALWLLSALHEAARLHPARDAAPPLEGRRAHVQVRGTGFVLAGAPFEFHGAQAHGGLEEPRTSPLEAAEMVSEGSQHLQAPTTSTWRKRGWTGTAWSAP